MGRGALSWLRFRRPNFEVAEVREDPIAMSRELAVFLRAVTTLEHIDDPGHRVAVEGLRQDGPARVREIVDLSKQLGAGSNALQQCLLMAAAVIEIPESVRFLLGVAMQPESTKPPVRGADPACMQSRAVTAEEALRAQAVEGLEALARARVAGAVEALAVAVGAPSLTVRAISLVALKDIEGAGEARSESIARLSPTDRYLADLRRVDVRDVDQIADPRRHLVRPVRDEHPVPRLGSDESWPASDRSTPRKREAGSHG